jgi:hypothetical protein
MRQGWWNAILIGIAVVPASVMLVVEQTSGSADLDDVDTVPAIVGSISVQLARTPPGGVVAATITVAADRPVHADGLMVEVRDAQGREQDAAGRAFDLPSSGPIELGVNAQTLMTARQIREPGTYSYVLAYRDASNAWKVLPPYDTFTIA